MANRLYGSIIAYWRCAGDGYGSRRNGECGSIGPGEVWSRPGYAVGFGTHRGTVTASDSWGGEIKTMMVPEARTNSWEDLMHRADAANKILLFDRENTYFDEPLGHRAIGVVYNPRHERGNYVPSVMAQRYDAFIYIDESHALSPLKQEVLHV